MSREYCEYCHHSEYVHRDDMFECDILGCKCKKFIKSNIIAPVENNIK